MLQTRFYKRLTDSTSFRDLTVKAMRLRPSFRGLTAESMRTLCANVRSTFIIALLSLSLTGCYFQKARPDDPRFAPAAPPPKVHTENHHGSIFLASYDMNLFENRRTFSVGDTLTIQLDEKNTSKSNAESSTKKESKYQMDNPTLFGNVGKFTLPGYVPAINANDSNFAVDIDSKPEFKGSAEASQDNELKGYITVTVSEVLTNGNLRVRGEKWININHNEEFIRLTGIINPKDIDADNVIMSTKVADARITFSNSGRLADSNNSGWLTRFFFTAFWPF